MTANANSRSAGRASRLSRRQFVARSLWTAGLLAGSAPGPAARGAAQGKAEPLSAAVIGAGGIARHHASQFGSLFRLVAVCDVDRQHRDEYNQKFAQGTAVTCGDYRELLDRGDIDVFFVTTPDHWHTKIVVDVLRSGKDVYCEKPLTLTVDEGRAILRALNETGRILQVGTQQRSDHRFQQAVALARSGRLGAVRRVTVAIGGAPAGGPFAKAAVPAHLDWDRWLGQAPQVEYIPQRSHGSFRWWYEYSGGKMTDWGAHHVDIALWALGDEALRPLQLAVESVEHPVPLVDGHPTHDDQFNTATAFRVRATLDTGTEVVIRDSADDLGFDNGLLFECEGGTFFVSRGRLSGAPIDELAERPLPDELLAELRGGRERMSHHANFYQACHTRTAPISDAASHVRHLNVCHLANIALRLGRAIRWDPADERIVDDAEAARWLARPQRSGFEIA